MRSIVLVCFVVDNKKDLRLGLGEDLNKDLGCRAVLMALWWMT